MESAVADHLHDAPFRFGEFESERHAAGKAEPAAGEANIAARSGAFDVFLQDRPIADRFVHDNVVLRDFAVQTSKQESRRKRARGAFVGAGIGATLVDGVPRAAPARDPRSDALSKRIVSARLDRLADLAQDRRAIAL